VKVVYSFNKKGWEAEFWKREIAAGSGGQHEFIPFNHDGYLPLRHYIRAQLLDNVYFDRHPGLLRLYADLEKTIRERGAHVLLVDNACPYHPDWLKRLPVYKVLRTSDGPLSAYDRDIPYLHAFDQVLFHSPAYSPDLDTRAKLAYCGARNVDFWPLALFDAQFDPTRSEEDLFALERDIDVVFVGALHPGKMETLSRVKKALGRRCRIYGLASWKKNVYFIVRFGFPGWVRPIPADSYVQLYERAKIGFNVHNRGKYTVGGYRLFELPANGVMQISDGGEYLAEFFEVGREIVGYENVSELIDKIRFFLGHPAERDEIARAGYRRVLRGHRIRRRLEEAADLISRGMTRISWRPGPS
jgi:spore maturation protein CgeB